MQYAFTHLFRVRFLQSAIAVWHVIWAQYALSTVDAEVILFAFPRLLPLDQRVHLIQVKATNFFPNFVV